MTPAVLVHGGAGAAEPARHPELLAGMRRAVEVARRLLGDGSPALDVAVAAVAVLEADPAFNAGVGAVLTERGTVEADATVMDGVTGRVGAIGAVPGVAHPAALARAVMDEGRHVLLVGPSAWDVAGASAGVRVDDARLITARQRARLEAWLAARAAAPGDAVDGGTVGAVALGVRGDLAAVTSTGGKLGKRCGRVGDSGVPGAGTWADQVAAVSATGDGDVILRVALARDVAAAIAAGVEPSEACHAGLARVRALGADAGVIVVDARGRLACRSNAATMAWARAALDDGAPTVGISPSTFPAG